MLLAQLRPVPPILGLRFNPFGELIFFVLPLNFRPEPGSVVCSQRGHSLIAGPVHTQLFSEHQAAAAAGNDDPGGLAPLAEGEAEEIAGKRRMRVRPNTVLVLCSCLGIGISQWMAVVSSVLCVVYARSRGRIRAKPACRAIRYRKSPPASIWIPVVVALSCGGLCGCREGTRWRRGSSTRSCSPTRARDHPPSAPSQRATTTRTPLSAPASSTLESERGNLVHSFVLGHLD